MPSKSFKQFSQADTKSALVSMEKGTAVRIFTSKQRRTYVYFYLPCINDFVKVKFAYNNGKVGKKFYN